MIRDYFLNYETRNRDFTICLGSGQIAVHGNHAEDGWRVTMAETGIDTLTGGRIKRVRDYICGSTFLATYGDGMADVDLESLVSFHRRRGKLATVSAVRPSSRYGELAIEDSRVTDFREKPQVNEGWINGGFFVLEPEIFAAIDGDSDSLETGLLRRLVERDQLAVYRHEGFWQCMDTYRETLLLEDLWQRNRAPWRVW